MQALSIPSYPAQPRPNSLDPVRWATYERTRGPEWLEILNPAECFGDIMIDYSHVECSSACVQSLAAFHSRFPSFRSREIFDSIMRGRAYLEKVQNKDGSW